MSKLLVKCLKCLQTNADNTVAAGGQGVGWAYCPSSCPVEGECFFAFACSVEGR